MSTLHVNGIAWFVFGRKDGKGVFHYGNCTISYAKDMNVFQFKQGDNLILARENRADCIRDATHCILDSYAAEFVPCWEQPNGTQEKAA